MILYNLGLMLCDQFINLPSYNTRKKPIILLEFTDGIYVYIYTKSKKVD